MGTPKHLLPLTPISTVTSSTCSAKPARQTCPDTPTIYLSLAQGSPLDDFLHQPLIPQADRDAHSPTLAIIHDLAPSAALASADPAHGLLAAFRCDPAATWLIVAVDYPFLDAAMLQRLVDAYEAPVTCFRNDKGFCEPLVGIGGPEALGQLAEGGRADNGPATVVRELGGKTVEVERREGWRLANVDTAEEWEAAVRPMEGAGSGCS